MSNPASHRGASTLASSNSPTAARGLLAEVQTVVETSNSPTARRLTNDGLQQVRAQSTKVLVVTEEPPQKGPSTCRGAAAQARACLRTLAHPESRGYAAARRDPYFTGAPMTWYTA